MDFNSVNESVYSNLDILKDFFTKKREESENKPFNLWFGSIIAVIGIWGIIGNALNIAILTRRRLIMSLDHLERFSNQGLFALAVSDFMICLFTFPHGFLHETNGVVEESKRVVLYYKIYGTAVINMFMMVSMWQIVNMAVQRYMIVVYPIKARVFIGKHNNNTSIIAIYIMCVVLTLPHFLHQRVQKLSPSFPPIYYEYGDIWNQNMSDYLKFYMRWLWPILAVFIPAAILMLCNYRLIKDLHKAIHCRHTFLRCHSSSTGRHSSGFIITLTLVAVVLVVILFICPVEILRYTNPYKTWGQHRGHKIVVIGNVLQILGFASNIILYVAVNARFRNTLKDMLRRSRSPVTSVQSATRSKYLFPRIIPNSVNGIILHEELRAVINPTTLQDNTV